MENTENPIVTTVTISNTPVMADVEFILDLKIALCELHARYCEQIKDYRDMENSTKIATRLYDVVTAYNYAEKRLAYLEDRDSELVDLK